MKITKFISIEQEVEIDMTAEDIQIVFSKGNYLPDVVYGLNAIATFLKGIPDCRIEEMTNGQREIVSGFLSKEANRYNLR